MNHKEFVALVERCRDQRGALAVVREAGCLLEKKPPSALGRVEKLVQDWSKPVRLDRAVHRALQAVDHTDETSLSRVKELLSALLLATGERAAEDQRRHTIGERTTT
jgi:hypothetical protein